MTLAPLKNETSSIFTTSVIYLHSFKRTWTAEGSARMRYSVRTEKKKAARGNHELKLDKGTAPVMWLGQFSLRERPIAKNKETGPT